MDNKEYIEVGIAELEGLLERLLVEDAEVEVAELYGQTILKIDSEDAGRLIGRGAQTLDAIQYLLNRVMYRLNPKGDKFCVDVGDYRLERYRELEAQAKDAALRAVDYGRPIPLPPMNPADRRFVHRFLADRPNVTTESEPCEDGEKRIMVIPAS